MLKNRIAHPKAFTIVELMVATLVALIVFLGVGFAVSDSHQSWNALYSRVYSDVVSDACVARRRFDAVVRNAAEEFCWVDSTGDWLEVCYYADANSITADRYARFFTANGQLNIEYGNVDPRETLSIQTICGNVQDCVFKTGDRSAEMILTLNNGSKVVTVTSAAVMHN